MKWMHIQWRTLLFNIKLLLNFYIQFSFQLFINEYANFVMNYEKNRRTSSLKPFSMVSRRAAPLPILPPRESKRCSSLMCLSARLLEVSKSSSANERACLSAISAPTIKETILISWRWKLLSRFFYESDEIYSLN